MIFFLLSIIGKTLIIELIIELLRQALYAVRHNAWANGVLAGTSKNSHFDWYMSIFESLIIAALLISGFSMLFIIVSVFLLMLVLKEFSNKIIK